MRNAQVIIHNLRPLHHIMKTDMQLAQLLKIVPSATHQLKNFPRIMEMLLHARVAVAVCAKRHAVGVHLPDTERRVANALVVGAEEHEVVALVPNDEGLEGLAAVEFGELSAAHADPALDVLGGCGYKNSGRVVFFHEKSVGYLSNEEIQLRIQVSLKLGVAGDHEVGWGHAGTWSARPQRKEARHISTCLLTDVSS